MVWGWVAWNGRRGHHGHGHDGVNAWVSVDTHNRGGYGRYYGGRYSEAAAYGVTDPGYDRGSSEGGFFSNCWSKIKEFCSGIFGHDRYGKAEQEGQSGGVYGRTGNNAVESQQDSPQRVKDTVAELDINGDGKISKREFEINGTSSAYGANTQVVLKEGTAGNREFDIGNMNKVHAEVAKALNDKVLQFATGGQPITTEFQRNAALKVFTDADKNQNGIVGKPELPALFKELGISQDNLKTPEEKLGALSAVQGFIQDVAALKFETRR